MVGLSGGRDFSGLSSLTQVLLLSLLVQVLSHSSKLILDSSVKGLFTTWETLAHHVELIAMKTY